MKRLFTLTALIMVMALGVAFAQDIGSILGELFGTDWAAVVAETGVFAGVIALAIKGVNVLRPDTLVGSAKYFAALLIGAAGGVLFGAAGWLVAPALAAFPPVLAGLVFGIQAALLAVGIHQGVKQSGEALKETAKIRLR